MKFTELVKYIDHTLLRPTATTTEIIKLCAEAKEHHFFSVCVNSFHVPTASRELLQSGVKVCTVVGFPLGANLSQIKAQEARIALDKGAVEIDMVANLGLIKMRDEAAFIKDIESVLTVTRSQSCLLKVIIETTLLDQADKIWTTQMVAKSGAEFIKTSTGFAGGGATIEDVKLMKEHAGKHMKIKASGGIKNLIDAEAMINAGASRLGTSSGIAIIQGLDTKGAY
jgi:deoxyribose-phosphate aldolase